MISREILNQAGETYIVKYKRVLEAPTGEQLNALKDFYGADTVMQNGTLFLFLERLEEAEVIED